MLLLKDITRVFVNNKNETSVLNGVSLHVEKGAMVSIMGPSGSGKSTLLHILGCLDKPTAGSYRLNGVEVGKLSDRERARIRNKLFGFVLQQFALIEDESVLENVSVPLMFSDTKFFAVGKMAEDMLKLLHIEQLSDKKVKTLSGGEKQRTAIARALVNSPDIILADEPTGALDSQTTRQIMELFMDLNRQGKTIIIITHDPAVAQCCPLRYQMVDGKLKLEEAEI